MLTPNYGISDAAQIKKCSQCSGQTMGAWQPTGDDQKQPNAHSDPQDRLTQKNAVEEVHSAAGAGYFRQGRPEKLAKR
jgi:hypothetical protein